MVQPQFVAILPILVLLLIAFGIGFAIKRIWGKNNSQAPTNQSRQIFPIAISLILVVIVAGFVIVKVFSKSAARVRDSYQNTGKVRLLQPKSSPAIWQDDIELGFQVESYSSARLAATALLRDMVRNGQLQKARNTAGNSSNIYLFLDRPVSVDLSAEELQQLAETVKSEITDDNISISVIKSSQVDNIKEGNPDAVYIAISNEGYSRGGGLMLEVYEASLSCTITCGNFSNTDSRKFSQANWMVDSVTYCREAGPSTVVVTGCSQQSCSNMDTARQQALEDAAAKLNIAVGEGATFSVSDLMKDEIVQDIYMQELGGSTGTVYRAKALAAKELSYLREQVKNQVKQAWQQHQEVAQQQNSTLKETFINLVVLLVTVTGCYFVCDFVTKGYYKGRIAIALVVVIIIGIVMLMKSWR